MSTLAGKTILVIGGSSGIGFGVAKASLLNLASHVIIASSSAAKVQNAVQRLEEVTGGGALPGTVTGDLVDATDTSSVKALISKLGEVDHLVWTSGDPLNIPFPEINLDNAQHAFDVRFWGPATAAQAAKIRPGGSITLTTGSILYRPRPSMAILAGIGGAVDSLVRGLAVDLAPIRVNVVCAGLVKTELFHSMPVEQQNKLFCDRAKSLLVKHVADADEIAEAYLFLMKCGYITGQRIEVDGGVRLT